MATYSVKFKTDNAAFGDSPTNEISRILYEIADILQEEHWRGCYPPSEMPLKDHNGNTIGKAIYD
jgi:hypothetical protein